MLPFGLACPPLDKLRILFYMYFHLMDVNYVKTVPDFIKLLSNTGHKSHNLHLIDVNYVGERTVPGSTKLCLMKVQKSKFSRGEHAPRPLLVSHMLCTQIRTSPPNNPCNLISPLGQKAEKKNPGAGVVRKNEKFTCCYKHYA